MVFGQIFSSPTAQKFGSIFSRAAQKLGDIYKQAEQVPEIKKTLDKYNIPGIIEAGKQAYEQAKQTVGDIQSTAKSIRDLYSTARRSFQRPMAME